MLAIAQHIIPSTSEKAAISELKGKLDRKHFESGSPLQNSPLSSSAHITRGGGAINYKIMYKTRNQ